MSPPVSIVHDYLTQRGGAERVVLSMLKAFPTAPVFTSLYDAEGTFPELKGSDIRTTVLNRSAVLRRHHRLAMPFLAPAFSSLNVPGDVVVCNSGGWSHGARVRGRKVVYCLSPARWLYQTDRYLEGPSPMARAALAMLRRPLTGWDRRAMESADRWLAISTVVQDRMRSQYGIESDLLPPGHTADPTADQTAMPGLDPGYFLVVSRLLPYKNVDAVIAAFGHLRDQTLVIAGTGPDERRLRASAGHNVEMLGPVDDERLRWLYANCAALVSASYEDFGLTPLEAAAFGKPSAVLRWGGFLDTVVDGETGVLFPGPEPSCIAAAVSAIQAHVWDPVRLRSQAASYSEDAFIQRLREVVRAEVEAAT